jgi:hypothetical protein
VERECGEVEVRLLALEREMIDIYLFELGFVFDRSVSLSINETK